MRRFSLRSKLIGLSTFLVLGTVIGVGVSIYVAERHYLLRRFDQSQEDNVNFLVQMRRESAGADSDQMLVSYLSLLRRSRALSYALIMDEDGRVLAHTNPSLVGQRLTDPLSQRASQATGLLRQVGGPDNDVVDLALPVLKGGEFLGIARVAYSHNAMTQLVDQSLQAARNRIVLSALIALAGGVLVAVILSLLFARPIRHLRDGARLIGRGQLDHRIAITSRDELGDLAHEFNDMAHRLHELDRLKQDFVSNVTHELRSPLTSLRGYVELLLKENAGPVNEEQRDFLIVIKNNAVRLARFIDNLLDIAKIESRKIELHPEIIRPQDIALEVTVLFRPMAEEKKIQFDVRVPPDIPPLWADADKLLEILTNLLSNAFKFTPVGGRVALSAVAEGDLVHFTVTDTGEGIPAESLALVFNKFEQVKPTRGLARKTKGTGLGLTIVKGFVEAHGGTVWLDSESGRGTAAHVRLPRAPHDMECEPLQPATEILP